MAHIPLFPHPWPVADITNRLQHSRSLNLRVLLELSTQSSGQPLLMDQSLTKPFDIQVWSLKGFHHAEPNGGQFHAGPSLSIMSWSLREHSAKAIHWHSTPSNTVTHNPHLGGGEQAEQQTWNVWGRWGTRKRDFLQHRLEHCKFLFIAVHCLAHSRHTINGHGMQ